MSRSHLSNLTDYHSSEHLSLSLLCLSLVQDPLCAQLKQAVEVQVREMVQVVLFCL